MNDKLYTYIDTESYSFRFHILMDNDRPDLE